MVFRNHFQPNRRESLKSFCSTTRPCLVRVHDRYSPKPTLIYIEVEGKSSRLEIERLEKSRPGDCVAGVTNQCDFYGWSFSWLQLYYFLFSTLCETHRGEQIRRWPETNNVNGISVQLAMRSRKILFAENVEDRVTRTTISGPNVLLFNE